MNQESVLRQLKLLHRDVEIDCGKDPDLVTDEVQPLDGLGGFDSPLIPTVIRQLAKAVGLVLPKGTRLLNPYVSEDGREKLPLREVAKRFCELYGKEAKQ